MVFGTSMVAMEIERSGQTLRCVWEVEPTGNYV